MKKALATNWRRNGRNSRRHCASVASPPRRPEATPVMSKCSCACRWGATQARSNATDHDADRECIRLTRLCYPAELGLATRALVAQRRICRADESHTAEHTTKVGLKKH